MQIDWLWVAFNFLWILGLAISLTVVGFARYEHPGPLAQWRAGWRVYFAGQLLTLLGMILSKVLWNWIAVVLLWIIWTLLDRFVFIKKP